MPTPVLLAPDSHVQIHPIQTANAYAIHQPTLSPQQHPDQMIAKPQSSIGQIPNTEPDGRAILGATCSIPGGSPTLRQSTDLHTIHLNCPSETTGPAPGGGQALNYFFARRSPQFIPLLSCCRFPGRRHRSSHQVEAGATA